MSEKNTVTTRFAPSPTGYLHIGGLRTAAYAYALAKKHNGKFILRIEDTDQKREVPGSKEKIGKLLKLFNLDWDEYYVQSERVKTGIYQKAAEKLVSEGHAFYCQCESRNAKKDGFSKILRDPCREKAYTEGAVKLRVPDNEIIKYRDFVHNKKETSWNTKDVADATLLKSDGFPTYHLAVIVDDTDMEVTHVLRGHDWLPSTPIHLLVYKYLGYKVPEIGHLTDILDPTGGKLSKRKGNVSVDQFIKDGYLPEALFNFIVLLGWAPKDNREMFTLSEFVDHFDENGFQRANPVFNQTKLDWFNSQYIMKMSDNELAQKLKDFASSPVDVNLLNKISPLVKERMKKLSDFNSLAGFFFEEPQFDKSLCSENFSEHLNAALEVLASTDRWETNSLGENLMNVVKNSGFKTGDFFMDLRVAVAGRKITPPLNESMVILGKDVVLSRVKNAIQ